MQMLKSDCFEYSIRNTAWERYLSDDKKTISEDLAEKLLGLFIEHKWNLPNLEKAILNYKHPDFTPQIKYYSLVCGKVSIYGHLFRKAVFLKDSRYLKNANEAVKLYALNESPTIFYETIKKSELSETEKILAKDFFEDFLPLGHIISNHYYKQARQPITEDEILPKILPEQREEIFKIVERHINQYISSNHTEYLNMPLFESLQKEFKVDRKQLLSIALTAYCHCAYKVVYCLKTPTGHSPEILNRSVYSEEIPENADIALKEIVKKNKGWYQSWTGSPDPSFSTEFHFYLRSLAPAIEMDFGFSAPHPNDIVKIAIKEANRFIRKECLEIGHTNKFIYEYSYFSSVLREKLEDLADVQLDFHTPFDKTTIIDENNKKLLAWYKSISENEDPPFNLKILQKFCATIFEMRKNTKNTTVLPLDKLIMWTQDIIFKIRMKSRIRLEHNYYNLLYKLSLHIFTIYIDKLPLEQQCKHRITKNYIFNENWYINWRKEHCPSYTLEVLNLFKYFSPLTEALPSPLMTPEELELQILESLEESFL